MEKIKIYGFLFLSGNANEDVLSNVARNFLLVVENVDHLLVDVAVEISRGIFDCDGVANRLTGLREVVSEDVDVPALDVEFQRVDTVDVAFVPLPVVVIVKGDSAKAANLHNLLERSAILLLLEVHTFAILFHCQN
ncbi:MAG: hypothetical protein J6X18_05535 [Bacteroidales bacterium]|nr:hypothetical protein [Bacteroidales bacterium]